MTTPNEFNDSHLAGTSDSPLELEVSYAEGSYIYDKAGRKYLDLISGLAVSNIGHRHPKVIEAVKNQLDKYLHIIPYGEFQQDPQIKLADKLASILPEKLNTSYFVNSGTEANEAAIKLAKRYNNRSEIISFKGAYHGSTNGSLSISGNENRKQAFRPLIPDVRFIHFNNLDDLNKVTEKTAAVIIEPIQGDAGVRIPDKTYIRALRKRCDATGTLLIFDEVQTGFGRTGKFFAFEHFDVVPDILTIAKAFGGGMPIGAFISSKKIMDSLKSKPMLGHITTFGGHPVNCAAALANIEVLQQENMVANVEQKADLFKKLLQHPKIKEIRSIGLMFAIEMEDFETVHQTVLNGMKNGIIAFWFLSCKNSFRIAPPLNISEQEIRIGCEMILKSMDE